MVETLYTEPKEEEILGTFLQLENTGEQDLAPVAPKQKKKPEGPAKSDKNKKDIWGYFAGTTYSKVNFCLFESNLFTSFTEPEIKRQG